MGGRKEGRKEGKQVKFPPKQIEFSIPSMLQNQQICHMCYIHTQYTKCHCCSVKFLYVIAGPSTWVCYHLCRVNMSCYSPIQNIACCSSVTLYCYMFITMKTWITFTVHIEGPIRSYEVLLEQR